MWDDIVIGKGNYGCSAVRNFDVPKGNISENSVSYWISKCIADVSIRVMKDTKEGNRIKTLIETKKWEALENYIDSLVLKRIKPEIMRNHIENQIDIAYEKGKDMKATEIRIALGLQ